MFNLISRFFTDFPLNQAMVEELIFNTADITREF